MWDGFDKRRFPRIFLRCKISILCRQSKREIVTYTENVGLGGVCVLQGNSLKRFSLCHVKLELGQKKPKIECDGKIVWVIERKKMRSNLSEFDTGIEFLNLKNEDKTRLDQFLQERIPASFKDLI